MTEMKVESTGGTTDKNSIVKRICIDDEEFPEKLRHINEPPKELYMIGRKELIKKRSIAIVGARKCTEYGKYVAMTIAKKAAMAGFAVVSGMALGIDNFAHVGALKIGGDTVACLGTAIDECYPKQHKSLYREISERGLIVSEYSSGTRGLPFMFPRRNRIISGLSEAVIVVEAGTDSGALITAEYANEQNKPVFAVPGNITSPTSLGTNKLITEGAIPVAVIDDIFLQLNIVPVAEEEELAKIDGDERRVYEFVKYNGETSLDALCENLELNPVICRGIISVLEIKGFVACTLGRVFAIK